MKVDYVCHMPQNMPGDLLVVNAARVSLDKHHEYFDAGDEKLINYLATHRHWTPFAHPHICLRVTVPIFVANQLKRHTVGVVEGGADMMVINEVSRRYVDKDPEFYITDKLGARAENKKQGAKEGEFISSLETMTWNVPIEKFLESKYKEDLEDYKWLLENGVAPEDARIILPLGMETSWYWTGSLFAFARVYSLRAKPDAQRQTQEVAKTIGDIIEPIFPFSWTALKEHYNG